MSWKSCREAIEAAAGRPLTDEEREFIADKIRSIKDKLRPEEELAEAEKAYATALSIAKRAKAIEYNVRRFEQDLRARHYADNAALYLRARIRGVNVDRHGGRDSLQSNVWTQRDRRKAVLYDDLVNMDAVEELKTDAVAREFFVYRWNKDHGLPVDDASEKTRRIADLVDRHQEDARATKNAYGAAIGTVKGYATRRLHDMWAIHAAGLEKWRAAMKRHFDMQASFPGMTDAEIDRALAEDFNKLATGRHYGFPGRGGRAVAGSKERTYVARSGEDEYEYFKEFGGGRTLLDVLLDEADRDGRDIAILQQLGPGGRATLEKIIADTRREIPAGDVKALRAFDREADFTMRTAWPAIAQDTGLMGSHALAKANMALLNWVRAAASGNVLVASLGDPHAAASLRNFFTNRTTLNGLHSLAKSFAQATKAAATGLGREERHVMAMQHIAVEGMLNHVASDGAPFTGVAKLAADTAHAVYQIGRVQAWWNGIRFGSVLATAHDFGAVVGRTFDELMPGQQAHLRQFGISPGEWDAIRQSPVGEYRGQPMLVADAVSGAPIENFRALHPKGKDATEGQIARIRDDVAAKFSNLVHTTAEMSASTPSRVMAAAYVQPGTAGTLGGAAAAHWRLFRSFADAVWNYHIARETAGYHSSPPKNLGDLFARMFTDRRAGQLGGALGLISGMVLAEWFRRYMAPSVVPLLGGPGDEQLPKTPEDAGLQIATSFVGSGAFGFLGTLVDGIVTRFPTGGSFESALKGLAGLSANHADNLYTTGQDAWEVLMADSEVKRTKKARKLGRDAFKTAYELTPFRNMWFSKWAVDYYVRDSINRWIDPEYADQKELRRRRAER